MPKQKRRTKREHDDFVATLRHEKGFWSVESDPEVGELVDVLTAEGVEVGIAEAVVAAAFVRGRNQLARSQATIVKNGLTTLYDNIVGKKRRRG
jgi:hypothetical protein